MVTILVILLVIVAILLMGVVLIQSSKGGGLAGTFGGGDATAVFGVRRTADFLIKITTALATILLLFSLVTNIIISKGGDTGSNIIQENQQLPGPTVPEQLQQPPGEQQQNQNQQQPDQNQNQQQPNNQPPK